MSDSYAMRFISYDWKFEHDSKILCSSLKMYVHRLILSDRHHDKPPIRAAVGAVAGDERQKVVVAGYGHIVLMQICGLHKIHEARKIIRGFKIGFFRREIIIAHIKRGEHLVDISAVQRVQMNCPMRLIEGVVSLKRGNSFLVQKKHSDYENPNACGRM